MRSRALVFCALIAGVAAADVVFAQSADLRYGVTAPLQLRYVSADTTQTTMQGMPMGEMTSGMIMSLTYAVGMHSAGDSVRVRVETESATGTVEAMGQSQRIDEQLVSSPSEFNIGASGLSETVLEMGEIDMQAAMSTGLGQAAASTVLLLLPGRPVRVGETWTDTLKQAGSMSGLTVDGANIIRGTYAGDTTVAGSSYHVLRYVTETTMTASGSMQGMDMVQRMSGERVETVLWDPARRIVARREHNTNMTMNMDVPMAGGAITVRITGRGALDLAQD
jgi:hypothetical protein